MKGYKNSMTGGYNESALRPPKERMRSNADPHSKTSGISNSPPESGPKRSPYTHQGGKMPMGGN